MKTHTPPAAGRLVAARNWGDLEAAIRSYEAGVALAARPGAVVSGADAIREVLAGFIALRPTFSVTARRAVAVGGLALHCSEWSLTGTDSEGEPFRAAGRTADVLRGQRGGDLWGRPSQEAPPR